nr:lipase family protein [Fictibacillus nanhaiensis]
MSHQAYRIAEFGSLILPEGYILKRSIRTPKGEIFGFIAESCDTVVVSFRGTTNLSNVTAYLNISQVSFPFLKRGGKTHSGITRIYEQARYRIMKTMKRIPSCKRLLVTGHSLGGSIATLFSLDAAVNTPFRNPILYTFATLPIGDQDFIHQYNKKVKNNINIVNEHDAVSKRLTPFLFRQDTHMYQTIGQEYRLCFRRRRMTLNHKIICYFYQLKKLYPDFARKMCVNNPGFCPITLNC